MQPQPLIAVQDVQSTSRWFQEVLGLTSGNCGADYEQLMSGRSMVLQLHHWDAHEHPNLGSPDLKPYGNGVVLWFHEQSITVAYARAVAMATQARITKICHLVLRVT